MNWSKSWRHFVETNRRTYTLIIGLLLVLVAGCSPSTGATNNPTPTSSESNPVSTVGYLDMPYLGGDAGNVTVAGGAIITLNWLEFPADAARYTFFILPLNREAELIGEDSNSSDGVSVLWIVPQAFVGSLRAEAYDQNNSVIGVAFSPENVSAVFPAVVQLPPAGECTATNTSPGLGNIYDDPNSFNYIGQLPSGNNTIVVGQMTRADDEWFFQITLENAQLQEGVSAEYGWVYADVLTIFDPCSNIPDFSS